MKKIVLAILIIILILTTYFLINKRKEPSFNINKLITAGMCPDEVIQKLGNPYFFEAQVDYKKWPKNADPQVVIMKQCSDPDESTFKFYFYKGSTYEISFANGKVVKVERVKN